MSNKIENDKYYTPVELAKYCIDKTYEIIGKENIGEIIEPSAGNGSFSNQIENCVAYDIEPGHKTIAQQDYLELNINYKPKRLVISNPPFGERLSLAQRFFRKSVKIADYISFILPISQLDNISSFYEFDLIHSEDLGMQTYTDRKLHCCLNIYKRPLKGSRKKKINKLKDIEIIRQDSNRYSTINDYDLRICRRGQAIGKILAEGERYAGEYKIIIKNKEIKDDVVRALSNVDWYKELDFISTPYLLNTHIVDLLRREVEGIE